MVYRVPVTVVSECGCEYHFRVCELAEDLVQFIYVGLLLHENRSKAFAHTYRSSAAFSLRRTERMFSCDVGKIVIDGDRHFLKVDVIPHQT